MRKWSKYNRELVERARVDLYFSEEILQKWYNTGSQGAHRPKKYSNLAIESCLLIRCLFQLPYRQTEGIVRSLLHMLGAKNIKVPSYSQINRRQGDCEIDERIKQVISCGDKIIIAVDSTGLSLQTPGQWHQRKHGAKKSKWIKLHAAIDVSTGEVLDHRLTDSNYSDSKAAEEMLEKGNLGDIEVGELLGDGAYDTKELYKILHKKEIKPNVRIRRDAIHSNGQKSELNWRDEQIYESLKKKWQYPELDRKELFRLQRLKQNYGRRSKVENLFSRFKAIFGDSLQSRKMHNIKTEIATKIAILNKFTTG